MLIYISAFFTISPMGVRLVAVAVVDFFSGAIIPLPFFPEKLQVIFSLLPFGSMQNVPYRIYGGDLAGLPALVSIPDPGFLASGAAVVGAADDEKGASARCHPGRLTFQKAIL